jgi:periplasmic protein TonB
MTEATMEAPRGAAVRGNANARLKESFNSWFWGSVAAAAVLHFLALFIWPSMQADDYTIMAAELEAIELPPEVEIPPPPEDIPRPAVPVIGDIDIDDDITIAETTIDATAIDDLPPPPSGQGNIGDQPAFTPYTVSPELRNRAEFSRLLQRRYPSTLRDAGIGGTVLLHVFIDTNGRVQNTRVMESSGYPQLDSAAEEVMQQARFSPAMNREEVVPVWVQLPVTFRTDG